MQKILRYWVAASMGVATGAWAQQLTIVTELSVPYQVQLPSGELGGPNVELVREIQRRVKNSDSIQIVPWARGYKMLSEDPNTVLFTVARTAPRNALFQWVGPTNESVYSLFVKADSKLKLQSLDDARRLKAIGVYRADARDQILTQAGFTNLERTTNRVNNLKMLMADRVDAIAFSRASIDEVLEAAGFPRTAVREALAFHTVQIWIAFSKNTPETTVLAWADAFESMKQDKTFEKIMRSDLPGWKPPGKPITQFPSR